MDDKTKLTRYFRRGTGEMLYEKFEDIVFERYSEEKGYLFLARNSKVSHMQKPDLPELADSDIGKLFRLAKRLSKAGIVSDKKYLPLSINQAADYLRIHRTSLSRLLHRLSLAGVIKMHEKRIYINPIYFSASNYISVEQFRIFEKELTPFLPDWVIRKFNGFDGPKSL